MKQNLTFKDVACDLPNRVWGRGLMKASNNAGNFEKKGVSSFILDLIYPPKTGKIVFIT